MDACLSDSRLSAGDMGWKFSNRNCNKQVTENKSVVTGSYAVTGTFWSVRLKEAKGQIAESSRCVLLKILSLNIMEKICLHLHFRKIPLAESIKEKQTRVCPIWDVTLVRSPCAWTGGRAGAGRGSRREELQAGEASGPPYRFLAWALGGETVLPSLLNEFKAIFVLRAFITLSCVF